MSGLLIAANLFLRDRYAQPEVLGEWIKVPIVVQQLIPALNAPGRNHRTDSFAYGNAEPAQSPEILRSLNRNFLSAQLYYL